MGPRDFVCREEKKNNGRIRARRVVMPGGRKREEVIQLGFALLVINWHWHLIRMVS